MGMFLGVKAYSRDGSIQNKKQKTKQKKHLHKNSTSIVPTSTKEDQKKTQESPLWVGGG